MTKEQEEHLGSTYTMDYTDTQAENEKHQEELAAAKKAKALAEVPVLETGFRVPLTNLDGNGYVGTLYMGS